MHLWKLANLNLIFLIFLIYVDQPLEQQVLLPPQSLLNVPETWRIMHPPQTLTSLLTTTFY
jgi:hypothetical protein